MANIYTSVIKRIISIAVVFITLAIVSPTIYAQTTQQEKFVVILDAGHGGNDTGAIGSKGKEKNINLGVVLKLGKLIEENMPDVTVKYTRKKDVSIGLKERTEFAHKNNGNLFISVHANSISKKNKNRKTIKGTSTYVLGTAKNAKNLEIAQRENSVITLEDDYTSNYEGFEPNSPESYIIFETMQNAYLDQSISFAALVQGQMINVAKRADRGVRQNGFYVLAYTGMPSVLVELDFICNPTQERYLNSAKGQKQLAKAIYNAFVQYKKKHDRLDQTIAANDLTDTKITSDTKIYKIQILSSATKLNASDKRLKHLDNIEFYVDKETYKYTYGSTPSWEEALQMLKTAKKHYPEAFIITTVNGKRI